MFQLNYFKNNEKKPSVKLYKNLNDCIVISSMDKSLLELSPKTEEVIVDIYTGQSVLRGSHIFAPGIMGMSSGKISYFLVVFYIVYLLKIKKILI